MPTTTAVFSNKNTAQRMTDKVIDKG